MQYLFISVLYFPFFTCPNQHQYLRKKLYSVIWIVRILTKIHSTSRSEFILVTIGKSDHPAKFIGIGNQPEVHKQTFDCLPVSRVYVVLLVGRALILAIISSSADGLNSHS